MGSRAQILKTVAQNKPELVPLPTIDFSDLITYDNLVDQFKFIVEKIGGQVVHFDDLESLLQSIKLQANQNRIVYTLTMNDSDKQTLSKMHAQDLEQIQIAYIKGKIGIAENGAIWVDEIAMVNRLLPIICEHLVLVLDKSEIVATMHHAYQKVNVAETGYGSFIAGPSKTADIEQSLVIGAHGPRSLKVCLIG